MLFVIAGLGNPGSDYRDSRHNVGFQVVERLASAHSVEWSHRKRFSAKTASGTVCQRRVLLLKPQTFMNRSGDSIGPAAHFYQVPAEQVAVVHDDVDLALGRIQVKRGGGHGGHRGLQSVLQALGGDGFVRVRLGVNRPQPERDTADYVLGGFAADEAAAIEQAIARAAQALEIWLQDGLTSAMNQCNPWPPKAGEFPE